MDNIKQYVSIFAAADIKEASQEDLEQLMQKKGFREACVKASNDFVVEDKPKMLLLTSWIVHEGRNANGQAFVSQELQDRVQQGLFAPPYSGMIDFNHDFNPIGFWYDSEFRFDEAADKWGVVAKGAIWAWRFPEVANFALSEMQRHGYVVVSIAAMPGSSEVTRAFPGAEDEFTEIIHDPVFFATSLLDIPPADKNAKGVAAENPEQDLLIEELVGSTALTELPQELSLDIDEEITFVHETQNDYVLKVANTQPQEGNSMEEKTVEFLHAELETARSEIEELKQAHEAAVASHAEVIAAKDADIEQYTGRIAELEVALESANETKANIEKTLEETQVRVAEFEAAEAEAKDKELIEARLAQLPEVVLEKIQSHENKEAILARWTKMSDEEWADQVDVFETAATGGVDYVKASEEAGTLPSAKSSEDISSTSLSQYIL